jgi:cap2 methyltransferase/cap3/cap4 methyltransferase
MIFKYSQLTERMPYKEGRKILKKTTITKFGQLKLFLSELLFLTKIYKDDKDKIVLYVGAASGEHINKLIELFPNFEYHLYDPRKIQVKESDNVKIFQKFFTDEDAKKYKENGNNIFYISDIRNMDIKEAQEIIDDNKRLKETDDIIIKDLDMQKNWIQIIRPNRAFIKFRLPYSPGKTKYFKGIVFLQQYGPLSTETRLYINNPDKFIEYDNVEFDEKLAYFNGKIRSQEFEIWKSELGKLKLSNNWDNTMMMNIIKFYLEKVKRLDEENIQKQIIDFTRDILNFYKGEFTNYEDRIKQKKKILEYKKKEKEILENIKKKEILENIKKENKDF